MFKKMILAGACAMSISANAAPFQVFNIELGQTLDDIKVVAPFMWCFDANACSSKPKTKEAIEFLSLGGKPITDLTITLENNKVNQIWLVFETGEYDLIKEILLKKYGKPIVDVNGSSRNIYGAVFRNQTVKWVDSDNALMLIERKDMLHGMISISKKVPASKFLDEKKADIEKKL